jgi:hypothetical protein
VVKSFETTDGSIGNIGTITIQLVNEGSAFPFLSGLEVIPLA